MRAALAEDRAGIASSASIRKRTGRGRRACRRSRQVTSSSRRRALGGRSARSSCRAWSTVTTCRTRVATARVDGDAVADGHRLGERRAGVVDDARQPELLAAGNGGAGALGLARAGRPARRAPARIRAHDGVAVAQGQGRGAEPTAATPNAATGRFVSRKGRFAMIRSGLVPIPRRAGASGRLTG